PCESGRPLSRRPLGRRAAARRHRAGARRRSPDPARRRAHRRPRLDHGRVGDASSASPLRQRRLGDPRDSRRGACGVGGPRRVPARWPPRRRGASGLEPGHQGRRRPEARDERRLSMTGSSIRALALVVALIALPVAAMVAGIVLYRTTTPTDERSTRAEMGRADLSSFTEARADLERYLPAGSRIEMVTSEDAHLVLPGTRPGVSVRGMDIDGLAAGMLNVVDGRAPKGAGEVAITNAVAELAGVAVGGHLELDDGRSATVVGIVENPMYLRDRVVLVEPTTPTPEKGSVTWLVGLTAGADPEAVVQATIDPGTGVAQIPIQSRHSGRLRGIGEDSTSPTILILGSLALVESALIAS